MELGKLSVLEPPDSCFPKCSAYLGGARSLDARGIKAEVRTITDSLQTPFIQNLLNNMADMITTPAPCEEEERGGGVFQESCDFAGGHILLRTRW